MFFIFKKYIILMIIYLTYANGLGLPVGNYLQIYEVPA